MVCQECQAELPEQARFCTQCGAPVSPKSAVRSEQEINTLRGTSVGVIDNREERGEGTDISSHSKIGTVESGGTAIGAILGGPGGNVHVGGQQNYHKGEINTSGGAYVAGDANVSGDFVGGSKHVHGDEVRGGDKNVTTDINNYRQ